MSRQIGEIRFGSTPIAYSITRSARRNSVAVTVHPDSTVSVVAPKGTRRTKVGEIVATKAEWILRQQETYRQHHNGYAKEFVSGESVFYLGRQHKLKIVKSRTANRGTHVRLVRGQLRVVVPAALITPSQAHLVRESLVRWYRLRAEERIPAISGRYAKALGLHIEAVRVRDMKKRWGSGGQDGRLTFNWRIIMAPMRLIEYVVAHELCHLRHNDHSKDFWKLLERVMPDYERRRVELAVSGPKFDVRST